MLCGMNKYNNGTYTPEGIIQIAEALKVNQTLQSIKYATDPNQFTPYSPARRQGTMTTESSSVMLMVAVWPTTS